MALENKALSVTEVAERLGVNRKTVYALIKRGELPAIRVHRLWRVPSSALLAFSASGADRVADVAGHWPGDFMLEMAGKFSSGVTDGAVNHDKYIYARDW